MKSVLQYLGIVLIFTIIGFFISDAFAKVSYNQLNTTGVEIVYTKLSGQFQNKLFFAISIGIIPLLYLFVSKLAILKSILQKLKVHIIMIFTGIVFWQYRILILIYKIEHFPNFGIKTSINRENLNIELYFLIGLIVGTVLSIFVFRFINRKESKKKISLQI